MNSFMLPWHFPHFLRHIKFHSGWQFSPLQVISHIADHTPSWETSDQPNALLPLPHLAIQVSCIHVCAILFILEIIILYITPLAILLDKERCSKVLEEAEKGVSKSLPQEGKEQSCLTAQHPHSQSWEDQSPSLHTGNRAGPARCSNFPSCWKDKLTSWAHGHYSLLITYFV